MIDEWPDGERGQRFVRTAQDGGVSICRCRHTSSSSAPPAKSLLPSASLRMIWSGAALSEHGTARRNRPRDGSSSNR